MDEELSMDVRRAVGVLYKLIKVRRISPAEYAVINDAMIKLCQKIIQMQQVPYDESVLTEWGQIQPLQNT